MGAIASCLACNLAQCVCCAGCSCLSSLFSGTLSQMARFGHLLIILTTFILAIVLGRSYPDKVDEYQLYTKINLSTGCNVDNIDECIYRQLIYRASFSLACLFTLLAILSYFAEFFNKGLWIIKFGIAIGAFIGFWWVDNDVFSGWAEVARVLSFFWLLIQGCSGVGLGYLFKDYAGCQLGLFYTILTLLMGVLLMIVSLLNTVNKGLLTPSLMFAYSVFLCWYALLSSPSISCNPYAASNWSKAQVNK